MKFIVEGNDHPSNQAFFDNCASLPPGTHIATDDCIHLAPDLVYNFFGQEFRDLVKEGGDYSLTFYRNEDTSPCAPLMRVEVGAPRYDDLDGEPT